MGTNLDSPCRWLRAVLPQLVDTGFAAPVEAVAALYILTIGTGYVCLLMGGLWMSRLLKHNLMDDVFNNENESFMQETRLIESEYSVNLPTRFYYRRNVGTMAGSMS